MDPTIKNPLSRWNFMMNAALYIHTLKRTIFKQKNSKNDLSFQNGGQITGFHFASFRFLQKFEKNTFPKEFFNEICLIIGDYEHIYDTEKKKKTGKTYSCAILGAKQFFADPPKKMLIYAN